MSELTPRLGLPLIAASQAQKHVPVNEALTRLDALVQIAVLDRVLVSPPAEPQTGGRYIVGAGATGAWAGQDGKIAAYDAGWTFTAPGEGWLVWDEAAAEFVVHAGGIWQMLSGGAGGGSELQNLTLLGLDAEADSTNPFSAKLNNALWTARTSSEGGTGDLRYVMNKDASANVLSLLMQSGYSGRAEIGLIGDEDLLFKVSADGVVWREAVRLDKATGRVRFPQGGVREQLAENRTYYVRTDGSDGNDGLTNNSGGAFLTIQKAVNIILGTLDLAGFNVTIQVAAGTYAGALNFNAAQVGKGTITLLGDSSTPSNVVISTTGSDAVKASAAGATFTINGFKIKTTASGYAISSSLGSAISFLNIEFGAVPSGYSHLSAGPGGFIQAAGNYTISGGANVHWDINGGKIFCGGRTITIAGAPAFLVAFARLMNLGFLQAWSNIYDGAATGSRYDISGNSVLQTFGAGTSVLPGNSAGLSASGAEYL